MIDYTPPYDIQNYTDQYGNKQLRKRTSISFLVTNGKIETGEVINRQKHVYINGMYETGIQNELQINHFKCVYDRGTIYLHPSKEGQWVVVTYYAEARISFNAENVKVSNDKFTHDNLHEVLDEVNNRVDNLVSSYDQNVSEVNNRVDNLILNQGNSPAEVADARIDGVSGATYALLKDRLDANALGLKTLKEDVNMQISDISTNINNQNDIVAAINRNKTMTLNIGKKIDISSNLIIPENIILKFANGGVFDIKSGITLTVNCQIEAGFYQIFNFQDDTAIVTTYNTWELWVDRPKIYNNIKLDWFGAKGNALFNWDTHSVPIGNNDTNAIKRAMQFVASASLKNKAGFLIRTPIVVEARPSATYYVEGDNILGLQDSAISGIYFEFKGNGCVFYHKVYSGNSFINNFGKLYKSNFKNFNVLPFSDIAGYYGYFINSSEQTTSSNNEGVFENIIVGQLNYRTGYNIVFNITSIDMNDNNHIKNCQFMNCNKIYYNTNAEAMGWRFEKCYMAVGNEESVFLYNNCNLGGGFTVEDCEILFTHANQTFFKLENQITEENFRISCRVETHTSSMTLIDIDGGSVDARGINMINGSGGYNPSSVISAKVTKTGFVRFTDCMLSENFILDAKDNDNMYYEDALEFNNCGYWQSDSMTAPYPIIKFIKPDNSIVSHKDIIASDFSFRKVNLKKHRLNGVWGMAELPITYGGKSRNSFNIELQDKVTGSKIVAPLKNTSLPPYINIRSLKLRLYNKNLTNVDTVKIIVGSIATAYPDYSITVNLNTYINGSEILTNKFIASPLNKFIVVQYFKGSTQVTDKTLMPASYLEMQYASVATSNEYQGYDFVHEIALV